MNNDNSQYNSKSASFFTELGGFMKPYKISYLSSVLLSIVSVISEIAVYVFAGSIAAELLVVTGNRNEVVLYVILLALFKVVSVLLLNASTYLSHRAAYYTLSDIRNALADKMIKLPMGYFDKNGSGRLKNLLVDRVEGIEKTLAHFLPEMTANLLIPFVLTVWMFFIDWRMALCVLIWIILGFILSMGMMIGYKKKYAEQIIAQEKMNQAVVEYVGGIEVIKTFNQTDTCYQKYEEAVSYHADYSVGWTKSTQIFSSLGYSIAPVSVFPVLTTGLLFWRNGSLSISSLFFFMIISLGIFGPIMKAAGYFDQLAQMGTIAREIKEVLNYPELERQQGTQMDCSCMGTDIKIHELSFRYSAELDEVISGINIDIPSKTMLALVGPSGGGKSTIAKLLAGYWDPTDGEIRIGGKMLCEYSQEELNSLIAYVDQDTYLFELSIMDNIRIGCPKASDEEVIAAAVRASCDQFIRELPDGYQTQAGAAGGRLSGGERQRIAIARAMMKNAPILILDEATASSDPENEAAIQEALSVAAADKTLIIVAHRLSTISSAEQIAFLKKGKIQALGTHDELLRKCPEYLQMWSLAKKGADEI